MSSISKITLEVVEDDGQITYREIDLTKDTIKLLDSELSLDFNLKNDSEVLCLRVERITPTSKEYSTYMKNPSWRI